MACLDVAFSLSGEIGAVALFIVIVFHLGEGGTITGHVLLMRAETIHAVPITVEGRPGGIDVVGMLHIELPVVVFRVIDAVLACTAIVTRDPTLFISDRPSPPSVIMGLLASQDKNPGMLLWAE